MSQFYSNWGYYYQGVNNDEKALDAFDRSYRYALTSKNEFRQVQLLSHLSEIYQRRQDYRRSATLLETAYGLSRKLNDKPGEMSQLKSLSTLYATHLPDDRKAALYSFRYIHLSDSLNESESRRKVNEVEAQYQVKRKQDSIAVLQKQGQLQTLLLKRTKTLNTVLIIGSLLLVLLAFFLVINYKRKHRRQQRLVAMQSVLKGQEEERSRLARDLHDGVGGLLSGIKHSLAGMQGNVYLSEPGAQSINNVIVQLDQSISELRRVSHNMMPEALLRFGLREALENYCANLNVAGSIKVQLHTYGLDERLEQATEIVLYRIVQELLNNVIRHARAQNVLVQLIRKQDRFSLTVEDDGVGFDGKDLDKRAGAGIANVRARAEYLGGSVDIHSVPGQGTSVNVEGNCV
jgi:two-component system NarL family sensor kinase